jgi:hypothetical protein
VRLVPKNGLDGRFTMLGENQGPAIALAEQLHCLHLATMLATTARPAFPAEKQAVLLNSISNLDVLLMRWTFYRSGSALFFFLAPLFLGVMRASGSTDLQLCLLEARIYSLVYFCPRHLDLMENSHELVP